MSFSLGIDRGGTWLRAYLVDSQKGIRRKAKLPCLAGEELSAQARALMKTLRVSRVARLTIGSRGLWTASSRNAARRSLKNLAARVSVLSDIELGHKAAFAGGPGLLVVAGTGSAAYGRDEKKRISRAGGLGPFLGDDGSAFWIARQALRDPRLAKLLHGADPLKLAHSKSPARAIAQLAPQIFRLAQKHPAARDLIKRNAGLLADLAAQAGEGLSFKAAIPVSWQGGLFNDPDFTSLFIAALKRKNRRFDPRPPLLKSEVAAAILR